jgi:hypothetical protein
VSSSDVGVLFRGWRVLARIIGLKLGAEYHAASGLTSLERRGKGISNLKFMNLKVPAGSGLPGVSRAGILFQDASRNFDTRGYGKGADVSRSVFPRALVFRQSARPARRRARKNIRRARENTAAKQATQLLVAPLELEIQRRRFQTCRRALRTESSGRSKVAQREARAVHFNK